MEVHQRKIIADSDTSENEIVKIPSSSVKTLVGNIPHEILKILAQNSSPLFVKDIKQKLECSIGKSLTEQTIYYHLRKLKDLEFIDSTADQILDQNDRLINIQKYYLRSIKFLIDLSNSIIQNINRRPKFLEYFNEHNKFKGFLVIGSRSNDSPYLGPISFLLGKNFKNFEFSENFVHFDTFIIDNHLYEENLILIGGPFVNNLYILDDNYLSELLPVKFLRSKDPGLLVQGENRKILAKDRNIAVIQCIDNPWNSKKKILIIGGPKRIGTESAVYGITKNPLIVDEYLSTYQYCLVEPTLDEFGKIRDVKFLL